MRDRLRVADQLAGVAQQVDDLLATIDNTTYGIKIGGGGGSGYTNWEEGLFHAFRNSDGSVAQVVPEKLVFFTDGVPNWQAK